MVENQVAIALKRFIINYFESEKYLQPFNERLSEKEIDAMLKDPASRSNPQLMDRLLDDPEALEMIIDHYDTANVISFEGIRKTYPTARPLKNVDQAEFKKVAASHDLLGNGDENQLKFEDDQVKGFIQIVVMKNDQLMISGHFELKVPGVSLRLILPNGQIVEQFEREENVWYFQTAVLLKIVLSDVCYELY
jgi:hypothetical protein